MNQEQILNKLNWFYFLETNQVNLYYSQSRQVDDIYLRKTLVRVAEIEQGHVENIGKKIQALGGRISAAGESFGPLTGSAAGFITGVAGVSALLKANIHLEERAMKDYKDFLLRIGEDEELFDLLWSHLIDEDLHTAWFHQKVMELESHN